MNLVLRVRFSHVLVLLGLIGRFDAFRPKGHEFESRSSRHVDYRDFGQVLHRRCLWRFGVKLRHSIRAVLGAPLSSSGLEEAL